MLVGRGAEIAVLTGLLERAAEQFGGAVVVRGMRVVGTAGVPAEAHVPYAGPSAC